MIGCQPGALGLRAQIHAHVLSQTEKKQRKLGVVFPGTPFIFTSLLPVALLANGQEVSWEELERQSKLRRRFSGMRAPSEEEGATPSWLCFSGKRVAKKKGGGECHAERDLAPFTQDSFIGDRM
ncbi:hypothetical protein MRX96_047757 [Rhipicephalus microplus]